MPASCLCAFVVNNTRALRHEDTKKLSPWQVIPGVDRSVVQPHFVVEMRRRAAAGGSHVTDDVVLANLLPDLYIESRQVAEACRQTVAVIDDDQVSVCGLPLSVNDLAVGRRMDLGSKQRRDVEAEVQFCLSVKRIGAISVMAGDASLDGPDGGCEPANRCFLLGDLFQQGELRFHLRRSILQQLNPVLQVPRAKQL